MTFQDLKFRLSDAEEKRLTAVAKTYANDGIIRYPSIQCLLEWLANDGEASPERDPDSPKPPPKLQVVAKQRRR